MNPGKLKSKILFRAYETAKRIEQLEEERDDLLEAMGIATTRSAIRNINQLLAEQTGRINPEINQRIIRRQPIIGLKPGKEFPAGLGFEISQLCFEKALPAVSQNQWTLPATP